MNFGVAEVAPRHSMTSIWFVFDKWTRHKCSLSEEHYFEKEFTLQWWLSYKLLVSGWDQLFCLEASIHFKICTWRQIIVNLKAKDYSFERYINSENRVVSLWYSIRRVELRWGMHSGFPFLRRKKTLVLLLTGLCYQMYWILKTELLRERWGLPLVL